MAVNLVECRILGKVLLECYSARGFVRKHLYLLGKGFFAGSASTNMEPFLRCSIAFQFSRNY